LNKVMNIVVPYMENSWIAEQLVAFEARLVPMELFS
jgi:hypothetical protein